MKLVQAKKKKGSLDMTLKAQATEAKLTNEVTSDNFCTAWGVINRVQRQPVGGERIFASLISDDGLILIL